MPHDLHFNFPLKPNSHFYDLKVFSEDFYQLHVFAMEQHIVDTNAGKQLS